MYWFMRMRQGSEGKDFASELWRKKRVGVMFGTWTIDDVRDGVGGIDKSKLTHEWLSGYRTKNVTEYKKSWSDSSRRFLIDMSDGDKVVVEFEGALHIATVTDEFTGDPDPSLRDHGEHFKCRRISNPRDFSLAKLPSSYRLISGIGRGAVQRINAYRPLVELLDRCQSHEEVIEGCREMSTEKLLEVLSPKQWETICAEYLRDTEGVRPLLLAVGSTLKDIDIYGVNRDRKRVLAQCKNDAKPWEAQTIIEWLDDLVADPKDVPYFFARGGVKGKVPEDRCRVVNDREIITWLQSQEDYERDLKTL